jgi:high-affinity nickel-transport protein
MFEPDFIMPVLELITSSGFASLLGMRHALEPDHIAAVSTLVSREQNGYRAAWLGVCWGAGHTLALLGVGLGLVHRHRWIVHQHPGMPAHVHLGHWTFARRPLLIGAIHGLAGSGALAALVLATLPSTAARLAYMLLFGLGSTAGMAALSGLLGWPLARLGAHEHVTRGISFVVGCMSVVLGIVWGYPLVARWL